MASAGKFLGVFALGTALFFPKILWKMFREKRKRKTQAKLKIVFGVFFIFFALIIGLLSSDSGKEAAKTTLFALGAELPKDNNGFTNILLLGTGGGETHAGKGHKLTDSIIVASIDISGRSAVLLSIPRDFYIETKHVRGRVNEIIRDESRFFLKDIRNIPENAKKLSKLKGQKKKKFLWKLEAQADSMATEILRKKIEEVVNIDIHRTARIDFRGFEKFVDAIGGIDIAVEETIRDETYPDEDWGYDPFYLLAGQQKLDGNTALKYARSRHGTSDFDRAKRQQKVLSAIKEKMTSLKTFSSSSGIRRIFDVVQENYISDIAWSEIITLAKFANKLPKQNILSYVLNDDSTKTGGFLVTPERELYGGAFVLVPFLNLESDRFAQIHAFSKIIFAYRSLVGTQPISITILNGTRTSGVAGELAIQLERFGWKVKNVDNAEGDYDQTTIRYHNTPKEKEAVDLLQYFFSAQSEEITQEKENTLSQDVLPDFPQNSEIVIIIGENYKKPYRIPTLPISHP